MLRKKIRDALTLLKNHRIPLTIQAILFLVGAGGAQVWLEDKLQTKIPLWLAGLAVIASLNAHLLLPLLRFRKASRSQINLKKHHVYTLDEKPPDEVK